MSQESATREFAKIAKTSDFARRAYKSYSIVGRRVGVFKDKDGSFYALEVNCKHQNADLTAGRIKNDIATCSRHGWQYNIRTGECLTNASTPLRRYALKVEGEDIYVSVHPIEE